MPYLADLHIHSPFSRATSKLSTLAGLQSWGQAKGIGLIGTGDFTHPGWFSQLEEKLVEAEEGLYRLADGKAPPALEGLSPEAIPVRFCLTAEISSIYKRHDRVRKVHNIIFAPDLASVQRFNRRLAAIGNIESDGRPILGLDSRDLLEIVLEEIPGGFLVPAHIWTPWFSLFGSKSGFDRLEDCYGDLSDHIFALETGLSSDPEMNRLISALDSYTLISNSDCHSPAKLGREVNIFDCELSFTAMRAAMRDPSLGLAATVEFYPEEGKYHYDGHRKCGICFDPLTCRKHDNICPVCGKPLTVGVSHRVMELADRHHPRFPENSPAVESLIPLAEIISELTGVGPASKTVLKQYVGLINRFGSEFSILRSTPLDDLKQASPLLAEAIKRVRGKKVIRQPGFDGQFGVIHLFEDGEIDQLMGQQDLFQSPRKKRRKKIVPLPVMPFPPLAEAVKPDRLPERLTLNSGQAQALDATEAAIMVAAGPGTGKTFILVERLKKMVAEGTPPERIAAITFTVKASREIKQRLESVDKEAAEQIFAGTFHSFCLNWLRRVEPKLTIIGDSSRQLILKQLFPGLDSRAQQQLRAEIISYFHFLATSDQPPPVTVAVKKYLKHLEKGVAIDLDAIIPTFLRRLTEDHFKAMVTNSLDVLFIDEFQDVNKAQYELVGLLAEKMAVFAIGDPDQAIYGFRGSDLNFFFRFASKTKARTIYLEENYRSTPTLVQAAAFLISHNQQRSGLHIRSQALQQGAKLQYQRLADPRAEAETIIHEIDRLVGGTSSLTAGEGNYGFGDIAILIRGKAQAAVLSSALHEHALPFQYVGGTPFFMKKECRLLTLAILAASGDCEMGDYLQLFGGINGIGSSTLAFMEQHLPLDSRLIWPAIFHLDLPEKTKKSLERLVDILSELGRAHDLKPSMLALCDFFDLDPHDPERERLLTLCSALGPLASVAHHLQQGREATIYDERAETIALMTLHSAKGLEFPVVFICGMEEGVLPSQHGSSTDIEEERRLFYVGITRAKKQLFLTGAARRFGKDSRESRFITELPRDLLKTPRQRPPAKEKKTPRAKQLSLF